MISELSNMTSAGARDLLAREQMGLLDLTGDERDFIDTVCEVASEHIAPPEDRSVESFDLLVGSIIAGFFASKAAAVLHEVGECPCR